MGFFPYSECGHNRWIKQENLGYFFFKERGLVAAFWVLKSANDGWWTLCLSRNAQTLLVAINRREQSSCSSQGSEFGGDLHVNEVTWLELAHQYLVTLIEVKKSGDPSGLRPKERKRLVRCLQGDGGVLFGASAVVVAIERDVKECWSILGSNWYACSFSEGKKIIFCHIPLCLIWISFSGLGFVVLELYCFQCPYLNICAALWMW